MIADLFGAATFKEGCKRIVNNHRSSHDPPIFMIIGVLHLEFRLHGNSSLKGKRKVAQSLKQKLRNKFNLAVSEVEAQDEHERLVLAAVTVSCDQAKVESRLHKAMSLAEAAAPTEFLRGNTEFFTARQDPTQVRADLLEGGQW